MNRIERIKDDIIGMTDPEDQMMEIMNALSGTVTSVPDAGGYYTFVYTAKTPNVTYDQHPLVAHRSLSMGIRWYQCSLGTI